MHYYLYQITNLVNNKIYVGVHKTKNLNDGYMGSGKVIKRAIEKHGIDNFVKVILETFENAEAMYAREKEVVTEEFLAREDVYNLRRGGFGGFEYINTLPHMKAIRSINATKIPYEAKRQAGIKTCRILLERRKAGEFKSNFCSEFNKLMNVRSQTETAKQKRKNTLKSIKHQQGARNSQAIKVIDDQGNIFETLKQCAEFYGKKPRWAEYKLKIGKFKKAFNT